MTPTEAHHAALESGLLPMWTVYDKPKDYPTEFVARMSVTGRLKGGIDDKLDRTVSGPTIGTLIKGKTLNEVREQLPPGLYRLNRDPSDDPVIVEVWI